MGEPEPDGDALAGGDSEPLLVAEGLAESRGEEDAQEVKLAVKDGLPVELGQGVAAGEAGGVRLRADDALVVGDAGGVGETGRTKGSPVKTRRRKRRGGFMCES